jgi:hypothetical protein
MRIALVVSSYLLDWRSVLIVVKPATFIRWHRQGWRLFWRWKSRAGRPPIPTDLRRLIIAMAQANPTWGEERIANELLLKLGLSESPRTVGRYLPRVRPARGDRPSQRWTTFVRNHAHAVLAWDAPRLIERIGRDDRGRRRLLQHAVSVELESPRKVRPNRIPVGSIGFIRRHLMGSVGLPGVRR